MTSEEIVCGAIEWFWLSMQGESASLIVKYISKTVPRKSIKCFLCA